MDFHTATRQLREEFNEKYGYVVETGSTTFGEVEKYSGSNSWLMLEFRAFSGYKETLFLETSDPARIVEFFNRLKELLTPKEWNYIISCQRVNTFSKGKQTLWLDGFSNRPELPTLAATFGLT